VTAPPGPGWHDHPVSPEHLRAWVPTAAVGTLVAVLGLWEVGSSTTRSDVGGASQVLFVLAFAVAVASYRVAPGVGLAGLWLLAFVQVYLGIPVLMVQLAVAVLAYGCGRYGSVGTLVGSAASVPAVALVGSLLVQENVLLHANRIYYDLVGTTGRFSSGLLVLGAAVVMVPWLVGVLARVLLRERQTRAEQVETARERDQAAELAELREGQAQLARDVHDVVGHSLAVILAQAESAQYLPDDDPERMKQTLANIAASARTSLQDVRQVLGATSDRPVRGGLDTLIDGVRASGHEVVSAEVGDPRPLPPELEIVAYRVLQEMLTNAIRHGRRDEPVFVERHWQEELRIEVRNVIDTTLVDTVPLERADDTAPGPGNGLDGMRRRLESVGGRLDVRPRTGTGQPTFTVTAWLPTGARPTPRSSSPPHRSPEQLRGDAER
jgi:signal transduction histidine kinase